MSIAPRATTTARQRRLALGVAGAALLLTLGLLGWMALPPQGVVGDVAEAPFTFDATLVTLDGEEPCVTLHEGDGTARERCVALDRVNEAWFADDGQLIVGDHDRYLILDPSTGELLRELEGAEAEALRQERFDSPPRFDAADDGELVLWTDGDRVLLGRDDQRYCAPGSCEQDDLPEPEVLLDLQAGPGYELWDAVRSPDGRFIVLRDNRQQVLVASADEPSEAYVWAEEDRGWSDLRQGIRWG